MKKQILGIFVLAVLLVIPAQTNAAPLDLQTLTAQLQTLSAQFDALKMRGDKASSTPKVKNASSTVDRTCMATAVSVRETSIATAWTSFNTKMVTALGNRKTGLIDAWNMTDAQARNQAIKAAWKTWKADKKSINTSLKNDRKTAWDTFKNTAKTSCKVETPKEEGLEKTSADSIAL